MAYGLVLTFEGVTEEQYWAVNSQLGVKRDGTGDWPNGMVAHSAGPTASGWIVAEIWASKADHDQFMASRLGPALGAVGVPAPAQVIESELVNVYQRT